MDDRFDQPQKLFDTRDVLQYSLFLVATVSVWAVSAIGTAEAPRDNATPIIAVTEPLPTPPNPFDGIGLSAQAAVVYDVARDRFLFEKSADTPLALASITKLMTAIVAAERGDPDGTISVTAAALRKEGDSGLALHERWKLADLIDYTMMVSSNDGAAALALAIGADTSLGQGDGATTTPVADPERRFVSLMNVMAARLGLWNTHFNNETGLDAGEMQGGSYGSARDVASLMTFALDRHPEILDMTVVPSATIASEHLTHLALNTNTHTAAIPNLMGSKTGFTDVAGGNLVISFDAGIREPIIVVVLGSTPQDRFTDTLALASAARQWLAIDNTR